MDSGIYLIECLANNKKYVGKTKDLKKRWNQHVWELNNDKHFNKYLQNAWNKYGANNFIFSILEYVETEDERNIKEDYFIKKLETIVPNGMNFKGGGWGGGSFSDETRKKMSDNMIGNKRSLGNKQSEETIQKRIASTTGKKRSEEVRRKMSKAKAGIKLSDEHKKKLSISHKGKILSDTHKKNIGLSNVGKNKGKASWKGKHHSDSTKLKLRDSKLGEKNPMMKLTNEDILQIRELHSQGTKGIRLAEMFNVSTANISNIVNNKRRMI